MSWFKPFGVTELIFVGVFLLLYGAYIFRVVRIAHKLNTGYGGIFAKVFIRTLYFTLFIVALLGPSFGESTREVKSVGKDIFIAIDLSQSMNATDVQPTRLEKVKFELKNIINAFSGDRIGVIIFSSEAFIQSPLTYDQNALHIFIETLHTGLVPRTGTDFGPPLRMALNKLNDENSPLTQQKSKIILLISDGEDFGDETAEIAEEIEDDNIKLFTLGVGTEHGSRIPVKRGYKTDKFGEVVVTKLDPRGLKSLADQTGGQYFEINESRNDVERLINSISQIEGELRDTRQIDVSANKYFYFLAFALFLLLLDALISFKTIRI